jgi:hypothetical protein
MSLRLLGDCLVDCRAILQSIGRLDMADLLSCMIMSNDLTVRDAEQSAKEKSGCIPAAKAAVHCCKETWRGTWFHNNIKNNL